MSDDKRGWALGFCIWVLRRPLMLLTRREWSGVDNLPAAGGCVVAINHVSEFDPLATAHFVYDNGRFPRFLGKAEVFAIPVIGRILLSAGQIPVFRQSDNATKAFGAAVDAVNRGRCVIVYPEGTLTRDPQQWPMVGKTGAARIAMATGCPLIPIAQWGPQEILPPYRRRPRPFPRKVMRIRAGAPVDLSDVAGQPVTAELLIAATDRLMTAVTSLLAEIRGERAPLVRFDPKLEGVRQTGRPAAVPTQPLVEPPNPRGTSDAEPTDHPEGRTA